MRASQELRWKQRIKENEDRRRRYEEASKRLEAEEKDKAQRALEERRAERARMDDLMRNPAQAPAPAKKPILRKGTGAVLRAAGAAAGGRSPRPATVPAPAAAARSPSRSPVRAATACTAAERPRREWSEGLRRFIAGQRGETAAQGLLPGVDTDALSWQELKLAAEAGFEELLRAQEAAAAAAGQQAAWGSSSAWRRPGMTRATGGGGTTAEAWPGPAQLGRAAQDPPMQGSMALPAAEAAGMAASSSPPVSKWAARMERASCSAAQPQQARGTPQPTLAAGSCAVEAEQQQDCADHTLLTVEGRAAGACQQAAAEAAGADAGQVSAAAKRQQTSSPPAAARDGPAGVGSNSSCASALQDACAPGPAGHSTQQQQQHLTAAAAQAAAALRASMDELHRSTEQAAAGCPNRPAASAAAAAWPDGNPKTMPQARQANAALRDSSSSSSSRASNRHRTDAHSYSRSSRPGSRCSGITHQSSGSGSISPVRTTASAGSGEAVRTAAAELAVEPGPPLPAAPAGNGCQQQQAVAAGQCQPLAAVSTQRGVEELAEAALTHQPERDQQQLQEAGSHAGGSPCAELQQQQQQQQQEEGEQCDVQGPDCQHSVHKDDAAAQCQLHPGLEPCAASTADMAVGPPEAACRAAAPQQQQQQQEQQEEQQQEQQQQPASAAAAGDAGSKATADTSSNTLDALLAEAKQLAALRRAVGAEFAAMGRSRVAAVMGAYQAADTPSSDSAAGAAAPPSLPASAHTMQQQAPEQDAQQLAQVEALPVCQQQQPTQAGRALAAAAGVAVPAQAVSVPHNPEQPAFQAAALCDPVAGAVANAVPHAQQQQQLATAAARAKLPYDNTDLVPIHQLGWKHEQQQRQQQPAQQLLQEPSWLPAQRQQPQRSHAPTCPQLGKQLSQLTPTWSDTRQQPLLPLQQGTSCSTPRRQLCITSNPLYGCAESSPPSPYEGPSLQQQAAQQQGNAQQQVALKAPPESQRQQAQLLQDQDQDQDQQWHPQHGPRVMSSPTGPRPRAALGPGPVCSDVDCAPHAYWPAATVSSYQAFPDAADMQPVQDGWRAGAVLTGPPALQEQPSPWEAAQDFHPQWGYQLQHCPAPVPAAAGVMPAAVLMQEAALPAAYTADMRGQLHPYPADSELAAAAVQHALESDGLQRTHADADSSADSGAGSSRFLIKLACAVRSAVGRIAVGAPQPQPQPAGQASCRSPARQPCPQPAAAEQDQGSYVAAALLAKQRAEAEAAERDRLRAAAEAAKQAAARRAAAERAEGQCKAAEQAAAHSRPAPVAIGSYARQQVAPQQLLQQQQQPQGVACRPSVCEPADEWAGGCCDQVPMRDTATGGVDTAACSPAATAVGGPRNSGSQHFGQQQACTPQAPPAPPVHRPVSPRRKAVRLAAAENGGAGGVLSQAADQHPPVSWIPVAPGTTQHDSRLPRPPHVRTEPRAAEQILQRQQQLQQQTAGACQSHAGSSADDDEWLHLERELRLDEGAAAASGQGYWQQQQQQWQDRVATPPTVTPLQVVCGPGSQASPRSQGMWAAVHAAAAAAAAGVASKGPPQQVRGQPAQTRTPPADVSSATSSSSSTLKARPIATGAVPPSTRTGLQSCVQARSAATDVVAPHTATATRTAPPAPAAAAHKPPCHPAQGSLAEPRTAAKQSQRLQQPQRQQQQQQHSRLSLEEANLLAELQQLDQRMHTSSSTTADQQPRDAPPSTAKLPALAAAGSSPSRARGGTVAAAAASSLRGRTKPAPATAPTRWQGGTNAAAVVKLAAVRGASRGGSADSSSSGCDVPPASAHRQQQQPKTAPKKQAKLVSMPRTAAADAASTPRHQQLNPAGAAAAGAGSMAYPASPQPHWGGPVGVMMPAAADPRLAGLLLMGHTGSGMGMSPGVSVGMMEYQGQLGAAWPEGSVAGTAALGQQATGTRFGSTTHQSAAHPGMHPQHAALLRQQQQQWLGSGWQPGQQGQHGQPMWWSGQMVPPGFPAAGLQPYMQLQAQQQHVACGRGGYAPYTAGGVSFQQLGRPGSGMVPYQGMQGPYGAAPPLTAPSGLSQQPPGSPLLPTLHYHETVMRHRTSSIGSSGGGGGQLQAYQDRGFDGGSGCGSRWGSAGSAGGSHGSGRGQQQQQGGDGGWAHRGQEPANVWPPRGVGRSLPGGGMKAAGRVPREQQGDGDIVMYNPQLLLS